MPTINQATLRTFAADPAAFRAGLVIDADGRAVRLGDVSEPWQDADFRAGDPGWRQAIGLAPNGEPKRLWLERARGHSKTMDIAVMSLWAVLFAAQRILGIIASGKLDQAKIVASAVQSILDRNPYMTVEVTDRDTGRKASMIECQSNRIRNCRTGSVIEILPADGGTSFGHLVDLVIVDEIANWPAAGEAFWIALASTLAKRPRAMGVSISNAGFTESWQYKIREAVRTDPRWHFSRLDGPQASWMTPALLAEQEKLLPPGAYRRLFLNEWIEGSGDALPAESVRAAVTLPGPTRTPEGDEIFVGGVDLGTKRDRSAVCILAADWRRRRVRLAHTVTWKPGPNGVDLIAVRDAAVELAERFDCAYAVDPWQATLLTQQLREAGVRCVEYPFVGKNLDSMASSLLQAFREGRVDLYDDGELIGDLLRLSIEERQFGFKLVAPRDAARGHCDLAFAFAIALVPALEIAMTYQPEPEYPFAAGGVVNLAGETSLWR